MSLRPRVLKSKLTLLGGIAFLLAFLAAALATPPEPQLRITGAEVDCNDSPQVVLHGDFGEVLDTLSLVLDLPAGPTGLWIVDPSPTRITAELQGCETPGTYRLTVSYGADSDTVVTTNGKLRPPQFYTVVDVTLGAAGPQGPRGEQGPEGPQGGQGSPGFPGPAGTSCWDIDSSGACDVATEDIDGDGSCTVADCRGPAGPPGSDVTPDIADLLARVATLEAVTGVGLMPVLLSQPPGADFGVILTGDSEVAPFQMANTGTGPTGTLATLIQGADANQFAIESDACTGLSLDPNSSCDITVRFEPSSIGLKTATLSATSALTGATAALSGTGTDTPVVSNNVGTEFYAVPLSNSLLNRTLFSFAVGLANDGPDMANVLITGGGLATPIAVNVSSGDASFVVLPWIEALQTSFATVLLQDAAYHIVSDNPITASQYNPLEYTDGSSFSYTNDASLLLPVHALTGNYRIIAWPSWDNYPGQFTVAATQDGTTVTVSPTSPIIPGAGVGITGGTVTLNRGDVVQVSMSTAGPGTQAYGSDPSGSLVVADKPIAVFGAHVLTWIPADNGFGDHLEEQLPPIEALGSDIVFPGFWTPGGGALMSRVVKVVATEDGTSLLFEPPQAGAPTLLNAGEHFELETTASFRVTTSGPPIIAASYLEGQPSGTGDPAMGLTVPLSQFQESYQFLAPEGYTANRVSIVAPIGTEVILDGGVIAVGNFVPVGTTGFAVADVQLSLSLSVHRLTSSAPVGVTVYGFGDFTSYMYPGGMGLKP